MDLGYVLDFMYEFAYFLGVFGLFFVLAIFKGRQAIINIIIGLYLALLISLEFPYYDWLLNNFETAKGIASAKLIFFVILTILSTFLSRRIMPDEFQENRFESMGKKLLLVTAATILVMIFSFNVLPITEFLTPGTPLQSLFGPTGYFFWWLLVPLVVLLLI